MIETLTPLLIITPVLLVLAIGIIVFVFAYQRRMLQHQEHLRELQQLRQRQMLEAALDAQEEERRRVARDLHDEVGGMLALIRLNIGQVERKCAENEAAAETAQRSKELLDEAIHSVRRISHDLLPVVLDKMGLVQAINSLVHSVPPDSGLEVKFTHNLEKFRLEARQELLLFRILQELVNNTLKYAEASLITINLHHEDDKLTLRYTDNGKGFNYDATLDAGGGSSGLGLKNMQSRVDLLNGAINFFSKLGAGIKAEIVVPVAYIIVIIYNFGLLT
ncbi:sensor histidine kinase [Pontibacter sp. HSC-36F09]|uniref:sensor histidine kinase n=1 Tax=Pontibacter sp. HSC-36F09 TaxID=2910966 RepID=UPI00209D8871|nr:histidine kinase [Pontibacter sp. HSC-36F09]MCP2043784.1 signal transduction histidine kinase [Pontibacter sp. HSC-36F09]